ncbi:MAG: hypothetical protein KF747_03265 [Nitrospira sp.]|nr:hypothetical protein [Nitrospira sp.]
MPIIPNPMTHDMARGEKGHGDLLDMSNRIQRPPSIEASSVISKIISLGVGG